MEIIPFNIVTPTGVKYRTHAAPIATIADVRNTLIKDGILDADEHATFYHDDTAISRTAEIFTKWTEIQHIPVPVYPEIRMCRRGESESAGCAKCYRYSENPKISNARVEPALLPLHRLYSPSPADHFYTTSDTERDACINNGYGLESNAGLVLASPSPAGDSVPFFRIYRGKEHFYTTDVAEKERVIAQAGTRDEGIVGHVYAQQRVGTIPLYRFYSSHSGDHFYTTNGTEQRTCEREGWKAEGIACYVFA